MGLSSRFPPRVEYLQLALAVALPIHIWAYLQFFSQASSLVLRLTFLEILHVLAYVLVSSLLDVLVLAGALTLLAAMLPARVMRNHFLAASSLIGLWTCIWAALFQFADRVAILFTKNAAFAYPIVLAVFILIYFVVALPGMNLARSSSLIQKLVSAYIDRVTILSGLFLLLDLLSLLILIGLNLV